MVLATVAGAVRSFMIQRSVDPASIDFRVGDVADLRDLCGPYDYGLDIGCLFTLPEDHRNRYVAGLERLLRPGSPFMLYAWLPRPHRGRPRGLTPEEVKTLFRDRFELTRIEFGKEKWADSAWYWFRKGSPRPSKEDLL